MYTLTVTIYRPSKDSFTTITFAHPSFESAQVSSAMLAWWQNAVTCTITPGAGVVYDARRHEDLWGHRYS